MIWIFVVSLPSVISPCSFWRCGTILNADDRDGDTDGGVLDKEGVLALSGNVRPACNLSILGEISIEFESVKTGTADEDAAMSDLDTFTLGKKFEVDKIEEASNGWVVDIANGIGNTFEGSFMLWSPFSLLSVVILFKTVNELCILHRFKRLRMSRKPYWYFQFYTIHVFIFFIWLYIIASYCISLDLYRYSNKRSTV